MCDPLDVGTGPPPVALADVAVDDQLMDSVVERVECGGSLGEDAGATRVGRG